MNFVSNAYFGGFFAFIRPTAEIYPMGKEIFKVMHVQSVLTPFFKTSEGLQEHSALGYPSAGERTLPKEKLYSNYGHLGILQTIHMIMKNILKYCLNHY